MVVKISKLYLCHVNRLIRKMMMIKRIRISMTILSMMMLIIIMIIC